MCTLHRAAATTHQGLTNAAPFCSAVLGTSANKGLLYFLYRLAVLWSPDQLLALYLELHWQKVILHLAYSSIYNLEEQLARSVKKTSGRQLQS